MYGALGGRSAASADAPSAVAQMPDNRTVLMFTLNSFVPAVEVESLIMISKNTKFD